MGTPVIGQIDFTICQCFGCSISAFACRHSSFASWLVRGRFLDEMISISLISFSDAAGVMQSRVTALRTLLIVATDRPHCDGTSTKEQPSATSDFRITGRALSLGVDATHFRRLGVSGAPVDYLVTAQAQCDRWSMASFRALDLPERILLLPNFARARLVNNDVGRS